MADIDKKLERFTQNILQDAAGERDELMTEIALRRSAELESTEDELLKQTYEYIHNAVSEIRSQAGRMVSERLLSNKRDIFVRREQIARGVFEKVKAKIAGFAASPEYAEHIKILFGRAFEAIGNPYDAVIYLRPEDMHLEEELRLLRPSAYLEFSEGDFTLGGIILDCHSKQMRVDESFDTALSDLDGHFAELFGLSISE